MALVTEQLQRIMTVSDQLSQHPSGSGPDVVVPSLDGGAPEIGDPAGVENGSMGPARKQHQGIHPASGQLIGDEDVIFRSDRRLKAVQSPGVAPVVEEEDTRQAGRVPASLLGPGTGSRRRSRSCREAGGVGLQKLSAFHSGPEFGGFNRGPRRRGRHHLGARASRPHKAWQGLGHLPHWDQPGTLP